MLDERICREAAAKVEAEKATDELLSRVTSGRFAEWQRRYEEHGIATFPVSITDEGKRPAITGFMDIGLKGSRKLVGKFPAADAFGFVCGERSGITVLDVDTDDETVLADAIDHHGPSPFMVRTASGKFHAYYSHNGERRAIRPFGDLPIDQLGGGFVVAPPSKAFAGSYEIIKGHPDDLASLPEMQNASFGKRSFDDQVDNAIGNRNDMLFRFCLEQAGACGGLDDMLDVAQTRNAEFPVPMSDDEVVTIAKSAWNYEERGENYMHGRVAIMDQKTVNFLMPEPHLMALVSYIKANEKPDAKFLLTNSFHKTLGWSRRDFMNARKLAIDHGWIVPLNDPSPGNPVMYMRGPRMVKGRAKSSRSRSRAG